MTRIIAILFLAFAAITARAQNLSSADAYYTVNYTTVYAGANTNSISSTNAIADSLYHTFYFNISTNSGTGVFEIDFSGDTVNWTSWGTVSIANTGSTTFTNGVFKQAWYRIKATSTNSVGSIIYIGGR